MPPTWALAVFLALVADRQSVQAVAVPADHQWAAAMDLVAVAASHPVASVVARRAAADQACESHDRSGQRAYW